MRDEAKKMVMVSVMIVGIFVLGILPWLLLMFENTRGSVKWLGDIYFNRWGWILVLCLSGYALKKVHSWIFVPKLSKTVVIILLWIMITWALIWFLLLLFGYIISDIT